MRWLVAASRASEVAILPQPCEGDPLAQAGCTTNRRASRHRSLRCGALTRRACARLADFSLANPRRAAWTSVRRLVAALCASEVAILPQPCEGDPLAQAGCPTNRRASRHRSLRCGALTRRACARLADFSLANPRRGAWTSVRRLVAALCASEVAIWPQPCEGDPLAQAGGTKDQPASGSALLDDLSSRRRHVAARQCQAVTVRRRAAFTSGSALFSQLSC